MVLFQTGNVMPDFSSVIPLIISHILVAMVGLAFMIYMLVDCAARKFNENSQKVIWILVIIFLNVVGAIVYYYIHGQNPRE